MGVFIHIPKLPPWPENQIILTFDKLKLSPKTRLETALKPVQQLGWVLPSPKGFLHSNADWHTLESLAHVPRHQLWATTLVRTTNEEKAAKELSLACYWLDKRQAPLYGCPMRIQQAFWLF